MNRMDIHVEISGRVQGVGYRAWLAQAAGTLGIAGWVRNRRDGGVEAVLSGGGKTVESALALMERGPPGARVMDIAVRPADESDLALLPENAEFSILPDA